MNIKRAVFLDRDGVLNHDSGYVHDYRDWIWLPGARSAVARLNRSGYLVLVVTNQSGVARGLFPRQAVDALHEAVQRDLAGDGAWIDGWYVCPHHPDFGTRRHCTCRKPAPGLLRRAAEAFGIDLAASFLVGDRERDIRAARAVGVTPYLLAGSGAPRCDGVLRAATLLDAADSIIAASEGTAA